MLERARTESLCPHCLVTVPAVLLGEADGVVLEGRCPEHGAWRTPVWTGPPSFESWCGDACSAVVARDKQKTCTAVVEVTQRCDLHCPVCFAESSPEPPEADPSVEQLAEMFRELFAAQGPVNVQLSGGEPTAREDLPAIIGAARAAGFAFVQLNTNGLRLASDPGYAGELRDAGLASVFLQFDGLSDDTYRALRGRPLAEQKLQALERCAQAGLAVVLVPTVVPGVNDHEIGALVRLAARWPGTVRGLHLQPVSYFGRYAAGHRPRLTLPEVLRALEEQTDGDVHASDFAPSCCEHVRCSFRARYWVRDDGRLELVRSASSDCRPEPDAAARRAIAATSRSWSRRPQADTDEQATPRADTGEKATPRDEKASPQDGLDRFLDEAGSILCISGMLFQDAWSIDLARVRQCCVHVVVPGREPVPFCLWNLTSASGERLYPASDGVAD